METEYKMIQFFVLGEPTGKGRPKFSTINGHMRAVTPAKTVRYENIVRLEYERQCGELAFEKDAALEVIISAVFEPPKSTSKKKQREMFCGNIMPGKKPDCDNIAKIILDSLNKVAFADDKQVVRLTIHKAYDTNPRTEVTIRQIGVTG